jgi:large subunit ribosomal protein L2
MGKRLIQQRRGRGTPRYRAPSHRYKGKVAHLPNGVEGQVIDLIHCSGHSAPLMEVALPEGKALTVAPAGIKVGDKVTSDATELNPGTILPLESIPEGSLIHNIELRPGDGGKLVRASGAFARVIAKNEKGVRIKLPSRKEKVFMPSCRASIGVIAGSGRLDKPLLKAGTKHHKMKAKNKLYPKVSGVSMNAVDHPFGGSSSHSKGRPTQSSRRAPPGRKVGQIAPRRSGRKK